MSLTTTVFCVPVTASARGRPTTVYASAPRSLGLPLHEEREGTANTHNEYVCVIPAAFCRSCPSLFRGSRHHIMCAHRPHTPTPVPKY